jgi:mono/diheme cytochrome c family protein
LNPARFWKTAAAIVAATGLAVAVLTAQDHPATPHQHPDAQTLRNPMPVTPASLAAGASSYAKVCAVCHGATGSGDGRLAAATAAYGVRPSDLTDDIWQHGSTDGEIFVAIRDGIGPDLSMNAWKGRLSDEEIWNVVSFIKSLSGKQ